MERNMPRVFENMTLREIFNPLKNEEQTALFKAPVRTAL